MYTNPELHPDFAMLSDYILHDREDEAKAYLKDNPNLCHNVVGELINDNNQVFSPPEKRNKTFQAFADFFVAYMERQHDHPNVADIVHRAAKTGRADVLSQLLPHSNLPERSYIDLITIATDNEHSHVVPVILENVSGDARLSKIYVEAVNKLMLQRDPDDDITNAVFYKYIRNLTFIDGDLATLGTIFAIDYTPERLKALLSIHGETMSDRDIKVIFDRALSNSQYDTPHNARAVVPYLRQYPSEYNQDLVLNLFTFPLRELQKLEKDANEPMVSLLVRTHIKKTGISLSEALATSPEWLHPYYVELLQ